MIFLSTVLIKSLICRVKVLKRNAQAACSLTPRKEAPSNMLADSVGMTVAAVAMVGLKIDLLDLSNA